MVVTSGMTLSYTAWRAGTSDTDEASFIKSSESRDHVLAGIEVGGVRVHLAQRHVGIEVARSSRSSGVELLSTK